MKNFLKTQKLLPTYAAFVVALAMFIIFTIPHGLQAANIIRDKNEVGKNLYPQHLVLPFAFYNKRFDLAYGIS